MRWLMSLAVLASGVAFAQETMVGRILDANAWITQLEDEVMRVYGPGLTNTARTLATLGLVGSVVASFTRGSGAMLINTLLRALIVSGLLALSPAITSLTFGTWEDLRGWSTDRLARPFTEGADELEQLGQDSAELLTLVSIPGVAGAVYRASATQAAKQSAAANAKNLVRWMNLAVLPVLGFILTCYMIMLLSGVTVAIANAGLPIAVAMLMFSPANGERWLGNYVGTVVSALLVVAFMPFVFNAAFTVTVVQPVRTINANFTTYEAAWQGFATSAPPNEVETIDAQLSAKYDQLAQAAGDRDAARLAGRSWRTEQTRYDTVAREIAELEALREDKTVRWWEQASQATTRAFEGMMVHFRNWLVRLGLLLLGTLIGGVMLWHGSRSVAATVGGVAMHGAGVLTQPLKALSSVTSSKNMRDRSPPALPKGSAPPALPSASSSRVALGPSPAGGRRGHR